MHPVVIPPALPQNVPQQKAPSYSASRPPKHHLLPLTARCHHRLDRPPAPALQDAAVHQHQPSSPPPPPPSRIMRSKPIAIELPPPRRTTAAPVYTPEEPLSARGDLPGHVLRSHSAPSPSPFLRR